MPRLPRLHSLDGLRAVAALMVFVHHLQLPGLHPALVGLDAGVLVFFALSGYLIYRPFVAARHEGRGFDLPGYAVRRTLRILPAYLVAAVGIGLATGQSALADPIGILLMERTPVVVAWTLQLEIAFYAVVPVAAWCLGLLPDTHRIPALFWAGVASIVLTVTVMVVVISASGTVVMSGPAAFPSIAWAFVPGMIVAELEVRRKLEAAPLLPLVAAGVGLIGLSVILDLPAYLDLAAGLGAGLLVAGLVAFREVPGALGRVAAIAGAVSYSFYLWHVAIIDTVDRPATWEGAASAFVLSLMVAALVYVVVERPVMRLARRLAPAAGNAGVPMKLIPAVVLVRVRRRG